MLRRTWITDNIAIQDLLIACGESFNAPSALATLSIPPRDHTKPPSEYLTASSYGQTITLLAKLGSLPWSWHISNDHSIPTGRPIGTIHNTSVLTAEVGTSVWVQIPQEALFEAAAEHSLRQAYRGTLPFIDSRQFSDSRIRSKAHKDDLATLTSALQWFQANPAFGRITLSPTINVIHLPSSDAAPTLFEAAARIDTSFLLESEADPEALLYGTPEAVDAFVNTWIPANEATLTFLDAPNGIVKAKKSSSAPIPSGV